MLRGGTRRLQGPRGSALRCRTSPSADTSPNRATQEKKNAAPVSRKPFLRCNLPKNQSPAARTALPVGFGEKRSRRTDLQGRRGSGARPHIPDGRRLGEEERGPPAPQPQDAPRPAPHGPSPAWRSPLGAPRPIRAAAAPSSAAAAPPLLHTRGQRRGFGPAHLEAAGGKEEGERAEERAFSCRRAAGSAAS